MREAWKMDTWCLRVEVYNTLQQWIDTASKDFADKNRLKKKIARATYKTIGFSIFKK